MHSRLRLPRRALAGAAAAAAALAVAPAALAAPTQLTVLHNNDGESKLAAESSVPGYGGVAHFKTVVDRLRAEADAAPAPEGTAKGTVTIAAGDDFLASTALLKGFEDGAPWPDATALNLIGYDASAIGNHELDFGPDRFAEFVDGLDKDVTMLSANLGFFPEPKLRALAFQNRLAPTKIIDAGGEKIGVIGLTTPNLAGLTSPGKLRVRTDLARIVNNRVTGLTLRGVNKVIVTSHLQGISADEELIKEVRGVDVWIAGGGNDLLADPDDTLIPGDTPVGDYPKEVKDRFGRPVQMITTSGEYRYVGRLTVNFGPYGRVRSVDDKRSGPVRVSATETDPDFAPADPQMQKEVVDPVNAFAEDLKNQPVGTSELALTRTAPGSPNNDPIRRRESGFGNLVVDSYLWAAKRGAASVGVAEPQVAIGNGGGIRADLPAGPISRADTFNTLPFFNQVGVVPEVGCEPLRQLLERGYSGLPEIVGGFANIAGMRVVVDPSRPAQVVTDAPEPVSIVTPGERVRELYLDNGTPGDTSDDTPLIVDGKPVANCPATSLATVNFTAADGDRYPFTSQDLVFTAVPSIYNEALEDYIAAPAADGGLGGTITTARYPAAPPADAVRRITIVGD